MTSERTSAAPGNPPCSTTQQGHAGSAALSQVTARLAALCGCPADGDGRLAGPRGGLWQLFPFAGCPLLAAGRTLLQYT